MPPSEAEARGYERVSKYPKSTRYGRQNPVAEKWNSEEQLVLWREAWAGINNRYLSKLGIEETIDHRSFKERGIDEQPTIHEGVTARVLEKKGIVSERCELNRQIRADNALLRELKALVDRLLKAFTLTVPKVAEAMESIREDLIVCCYHLNVIHSNQKKFNRRVSNLKDKMKEYDEFMAEISVTDKERQDLVAEKNATPFWNIPRHRKFDARIAELDVILKERLTKKEELLKALKCADDSGIPKAKQNIAGLEEQLKEYAEVEKIYADKKDAALKEYSELKKELDLIELYETRKTIRSEKIRSAISRLQKTFGDKYSGSAMLDRKDEVSRLLNDSGEEWAVRERIKRQKQQANEQRQTNDQQQRKRSRGMRR